MIWKPLLYRRSPCKATSPHHETHPIEGPIELNTLADYTSPALMVPELQSKVAAGVITELCSLLERQERLSDSAALYEAVITRELLSPTTIAPGWVLPHA